jgi:hypothetical protein
LDQFVSRQVLHALEPAALDLSLEAASHLERERDDLAKLWRQRLERAAYEAERAGRHYRLVEPENRLVARQLERDWEEKLAAHQRLEEEHHRFERSQPRLLSAEERESIRRLAEDIPALWEASTTTDAERKEIIRQVIERVVVDAQGDSERVSMAIEWVGGVRSEEVMIRPVARFEQLSYYGKLCERITALASEGLACSRIAEHLNAEGYRPPKRRERFDGPGVQDLVRRLSVSASRPCRQVTPGILGPDEWYLAALALQVPMPVVTLFNWVKRGWVRAEQREQAPRRWVAWADEAEIERLRERHRRPNGYYTRRLWVETDEESDLESEETSESSKPVRSAVC